MGRRRDNDSNASPSPCSPCFDFRSARHFSLTLRTLVLFSYQSFRTSSSLQLAPTCKTDVRLSLSSNLTCLVKSGRTRTERKGKHSNRRLVPLQHPTHPSFPSLFFTTHHPHLYHVYQCCQRSSSSRSVSLSRLYQSSSSSSLSLSYPRASPASAHPLPLSSFPSSSTGKVSPAQAEILTPEALTFLASLHRTFDGKRKEVSPPSHP